MTVCKRCGKENQDHYKFCLGCGSEIGDVDSPSSSPSSSVGMMNTVMADSDNNGAVSEVAESSAERPSTASGHPDHSKVQNCPECNAEVPPTFKFCGACGTSLAGAVAPAAPAHAASAKSQPAPQAQPSALLTLIRPDGSEGGTHPIKSGENFLGRNHGDVFANDGYLSPEHAVLTLENNQAIIRDCSSLNGVFVRISKDEKLEDGNILRIGQELIRFNEIGTPDLLSDGTEIMGSPNPGYWGKLTVVIGQSLDGASYPLLGDGVTLGRERGDINFPDDGYVSGLHAKVFYQDGTVFLSDQGSSNGTFLRITEEREIPSESFVLLGQQLFRVDF